MEIKPQDIRQDIRQDIDMRLYTCKGCERKFDKMTYYNHMTCANQLNHLIDNLKKEAQSKYDMLYKTLEDVHSAGVHEIEKRDETVEKLNKTIANLHSEINRMRLGEKEYVRRIEMLERIVEDNKTTIHKLKLDHTSELNSIHRNHEKAILQLESTHSDEIETVRSGTTSRFAYEAEELRIAVEHWKERYKVEVEEERKLRFDEIQKIREAHSMELVREKREWERVVMEKDATIHRLDGSVKELGDSKHILDEKLKGLELYRDIKTEFGEKIDQMYLMISRLN